jgi:hypothetical protein
MAHDGDCADTWLRTGVDPQAPDAPLLVVVIDPAAGPGERAVRNLLDHGYEGDGAFYLLPTDAWVERQLDGTTLTVRIVAPTDQLDELDIEDAGFAEPEPGDTVLLERVTTVDPALYARTGPGTMVFASRRGTSPAEVVAAIHAADDWPLILGPRQSR